MQCGPSNSWRTIPLRLEISPSIPCYLHNTCMVLDTSTLRLECVYSNPWAVCGLLTRTRTPGTTGNIKAGYEDHRNKANTQLSIVRRSRLVTILIRSSRRQNKNWQYDYHCFVYESLDPRQITRPKPSLDIKDDAHPYLYWMNCYQILAYWWPLIRHSLIRAVNLFN